MLSAQPTQPLICLGESAPLGGIADDIAVLAGKGPQFLSAAVVVVTKLEPYLPLIVDAATDPALPKVMAKVKTIRALATKSTVSKPAGAAPAAPKPRGIGLEKFLTPLDAAIWYLRYPWAPWAIGAGVVFGIGGGSFLLGRWAGKRSAAKAKATLGRRRGRRPRYLP
jgi:hypothetical protein